MCRPTCLVEGGGRGAAGREGATTTGADLPAWLKGRGGGGATTTGADIPAWLKAVGGEGRGGAATTGVDLPAWLRAGGGEELPPAGRWGPVKAMGGSSTSGHTPLLPGSCQHTHKYITHIS